MSFHRCLECGEEKCPEYQKVSRAVLGLALLAFMVLVFGIIMLAVKVSSTNF